MAATATIIPGQFCRELSVHQTRRRAFTVAMERLTKASKRVGLPAPLVEWQGDKREAVEVINGEVHSFHRETVRITTAPMVHAGGWRFVATADLTLGTPLLHGDVDSLTPAERQHLLMSAADGRCDHCAKKRRRNTVVAIRSESGELKVLGTACLKDFLPGYNQTPSALSAFIHAWLPSSESFSERDEGGPHGPRDCAFPVRRVAAFVLWQQQAQGNRCYRGADYVDAYCFVNWPSKAASEHQEDAAQRLAAFTAALESGEFDARVESARAAFDDRPDGFAHNARVVLREELVEIAHMNILCAAVASFGKTAAAKKATVDVKEFAAEVGATVEVKVTLLHPVREIDGHYGTRHLHTFLTECGSILKWWGSKRVYPAVEAGDKFTLRCKVKKHGSYNEKPETTVTHCKSV